MIVMHFKLMKLQKKESNIHQMKLKIVLKKIRNGLFLEILMEIYVDNNTNWYSIKIKDNFWLYYISS